MKKILVISPWESRWSLGTGAGVSDDYNFINKLSTNGFELHFLIPGGKTPSGLTVENFHTHSYTNFFRPTMKWPTFLRRLLWPTLFNIIVTFRVLQISRRIKPDFILGHSHYSAFPSYMARELFRVPSAVKLFGVMDLVHFEWPRWRYIFKNIEQILALKIPQDMWIILDDGTRGKEAAIRHGVPDEKVRFLPNGINLEWADRPCNPADVREEFGIPADVRVVLFLARLVASKRPELLIRAIPEIVRKSEQKVLFLFAGDGVERRVCETLVRELGVEDHVKFLGSVPHERVPDIMKISDMFVSTSSLTNVAIPTCEALLCGLPIVAFDVGSTRQLIQDGETGYVAPDGDIGKLADAITRLLADDQARKNMSAHAKKLAIENFTSWDQRTNMEIEIITETIDKGISALAHT